MKKKVLAIAVCAIMALSLAALAGCSGQKKLVKDGELHVALNNGYAGFEELNEDGTYTGYDIEIAQMIADKLKVKLVIDDMAFDTVIPQVKAGSKVDLGISGITINDERKKEITFSDPYYEDSQSVTVVKGGKYTKDNYKEALNQEGVVIFAQQGTSGEDYAKENFPKATVTGIPEIPTLFATLAAGKCDAVVQNAAPTTNIVANYSNLSVIDTIATGEEYGIAVNSNNKELLNEVNAMLKTWKSDGTLTKLALKYNV